MNEESMKERIYERLRHYGVHERIEIEPEAEEMILTNLLSDNINQVWLEDGALMIDFND